MWSVDWTRNRLIQKQPLFSENFFKISKLIGCKLTKIRDLEFEYKSGACNSFSKFGILFCFGEDATRRCYSMNISKNGSITVKKEKSSIYEHKKVLSLASYRGSPFVTGSYDPDHNKTELLNIDQMRWERKPDFPETRYFGSHLSILSRHYFQNKAILSIISLRWVFVRKIQI